MLIRRKRLFGSLHAVHNIAAFYKCYHEVFFKSAIFWAEEMLRCLIVWITFIGASHALRKIPIYPLMCCTIFLGPGKNGIWKIFINIAGLVFRAAMVYISGVLYLAGQGYSTSICHHWKCSMVLSICVFPLALCFYAVHSVEAVCRLIKGRTKEEGHGFVTALVLLSFSFYWP